METRHKYKACCPQCKYEYTISSLESLEVDWCPNCGQEIKLVGGEK